MSTTLEATRNYLLSIRGVKAKVNNRLAIQMEDTYFSETDVESYEVKDDGGEVKLYMKSGQDHEFDDEDDISTFVERMASYTDYLYYIPLNSISTIGISLVDGERELTVFMENGDHIIALDEDEIERFINEYKSLFRRKGGWINEKLETPSWCY